MAGNSRGGALLSLIGRAVRHPVLHNAAALGAVQLLSYLVQLVSLPYLARTLRPSAFGDVVLAQSLMYLMSFLMEFGFGASATRDIARNRDNREAQAQIVGDVIGAKLMLMTGTLVLALVLYRVLPPMREHPLLLGLAWGGAVFQGLWPLWYFVGTENMKAVSVIDVACRAAAAGLMFALVHSPGDGWIAVGLWAGANILSTLISGRMLYRELAFRRPHRAGSLAALRSSWRLFIAGAATQLYTSANMVILGWLVAPAQVARYGGAERLTRAGARLLGPISLAVFPRVTYSLARGDHSGARRLARLSFLVMGGLGLLAAGVTAILAPKIVSLLYGPGYEEAGNILRILGFMLPAVAVSNVLGTQWLIPLGKDRAVTLVLVVASVWNVALAFALVSLIGPVGMAWTVVSTETLIVVLWGLIALRTDSRKAMATARGEPEPVGDERLTATTA